MKDDITIPQEALEAAGGIVAEYRISARSDAGIAYQVCLAMLKAWPGMHHYEPNAEPYYGKHIILPLTENTDVEA